MLKKWNIEGFKSIYDRKEFQISPLTIFTGANSSGKSSVIQSILLTVQTFKNPLKNNQILLNGPLVKLGDFDDIQSYGSNKDITIGFGLDFSGVKSDILDESYEIHEGNYDKNGDNIDYSDLHGSLLEDRMNDVEIDYKFNLLPSKKDSQFYPKINMVKVKTYINPLFSQDYNEIIVKESNFSLEEKKKLFNIKLSHESELKYDIYEMQYTEPEEHKEVKSLKDEIPLPSVKGSAGKPMMLKQEKQQFVGAHFTGFIFFDLYALKDLNVMITDLIFVEYSTYKDNQIPLYYDELMQNQDFLTIFLTILEIIIEFLKKYNIVDISSNEMLAIHDRILLTNDHNSLLETAKYINEFLFSVEHFDLSYSDGLRAKILNYIKENLEPAYTVTKLKNEDINNQYFISEYFQNRVKYLGPLREEPKPLYTTNIGAFNSTNVGSKGEFTSLVLEMNKDMEINYISPNELEFKEYEVIKGKLIDAVLEWVIYLGIGNDIRTVDHGSLGHKLKIQLEKGGKFVDLTNVGVGVSQILPILVSSLLTEKKSTLIFEQPELHLHPKVQTRLADFFITMIQLDKQCIIETHSEHMINRLRYKAVSSPKDAITENALIYFVERENGCSEYRQIRINEYGSIGKWPKGFFDESELNALSILKAVRAKKRGE